MLPSDIPKRQRRAERNAGAGVVAAHDAGHVVADGVEARDRLAVGVQRAGVLVGLGDARFVAQRKIGPLEGAAFFAIGRLELLRRRLGFEAGLFDGFGHFGDRHQRTRDLIEQLIGIFFFRQ